MPNTTQAIIDHLRWLASSEHAQLVDGGLSHDMQLVHGARKDAFLQAADAIESGDLEKFAALVADAKHAGILEVPRG